MRKKVSLRVVLALVMLASSSVPVFPDDWKNNEDDVSMELIGQLAASGASAFQFGYLSYINGIDTANIFSGAPQDETTALFSFYNDTTTRRVINNGSMRAIDRDGTTTIYLNLEPDRSFLNPASFTDGTPVLTMRLRQQVIIDLVTGSFTATFVLNVTSNESFSLGDRTIRLGKVGQTLRATVNGHLNTPAPPAGYIAGFVVGGDLTR